MTLGILRVTSMLAAKKHPCEKSTTLIGAALQLFAKADHFPSLRFLAVRIYIELAKTCIVTWRDLVCMQNATTWHHQHLRNTERRACIQYYKVQ